MNAGFRAIFQNENLNEAGVIRQLQEMREEGLERRYAMHAAVTGG